MADAIPASLKYSAQSAQARVIKQTVQPQGNSNGTSASQSIFRFRLPEKSLVDLRSIAIYYDYAFTGTVDAAANWSTAAIPASYKHFSQVKWYVSGAPASNHMCNHYDMVYDALRKASTNAEWCNSRLGNGYGELLGSTNDDTAPLLNARPGAQRGGARMCFDDLLGLANSKNYVLDTSLFGVCELELVMSPSASIRTFTAGDDSANTAGIAGSITNIKLCIDTVVSISPLYVSLLAERLQVDTPIRLPFQNIYSNVVGTNGSNRLQLNSGCVDALLVAPLAYDPNTRTTSAVAQANAVPLNVARYKFDSGRTAANASQATIQLQVGADLYPRQPARLDEVADITMNALFGNSRASTNMLFYNSLSTTAGVVTPSFSKTNFYTDNCVMVHKFMLGEEGWASGSLQGIQCNGVATDFIVNTSNIGAGNYLLIAALQTSQLVFNPATSAVSVEA